MALTCVMLGEPPGSHVCRVQGPPTLTCAELRDPPLALTCAELRDPHWLLRVPSSGTPTLTCVGVGNLTVVVHTALQGAGRDRGPGEGVLTVLHSTDKLRPGVLQRNTKGPTQQGHVPLLGIAREPGTCQERPVLTATAGKGPITHAVARKVSKGWSTRWDSLGMQRVPRSAGITPNTVSAGQATEGTSAPH